MFLSSDGKPFWEYMEDPNITESLLEDITEDFLRIGNKHPTMRNKSRYYKVIILFLRLTILFLRLPFLFIFINMIVFKQI